MLELEDRLEEIRCISLVRGLATVLFRALAHCRLRVETLVLYFAVLALADGILT